MPHVRHLPHAPIAEASINFEVDASQGWDADRIRSVLAVRWSEFELLSVFAPVEVSIQAASDDEAHPVAEEKPVQGLLYESKAALLQVRRDGFAFLRRSPYSGWNQLVSDTLAKWADYQEILKPSELHGVWVGFNNRLEFDLEGFSLKRFFVAAPTVPAGLNWLYYSVQQTLEYAPPDQLYRVRVTFLPAFVANPSKSISFLLSVDVLLNEPFSATGRSLDTVLTEMHNLKNEAFFNLLTEEAILRYI